MMTPFSSPADQELFYVVYFVWVSMFVVERALIGRGGGGAARRADRGSALLIYVSVFVSVAVAYAFALSGITLLPEPFFYLGISMMLFGIAVREWAVATLRSYFSYVVRVREDHRVIQSGPYRYVRHPAYTGSIITILGLGVALRSLPGVLVLVAFFSVAYWYRIRVEERALLSAMGQEYGEYMKRTKRLVPFVI
jgi:protein-S-isoprenylcysteine O-methyltransferase Ste14